MKIIILSAGKGERLLPLTKDKPKVLIELGDGTTLLSRQYANLAKFSDVDEIIIGAGHCVQRVEEYVAKIGKNIGTRVIYNPFYPISGPLVTLWVVLNQIDVDDFMFINGDTLYSNNVYKAIHDLMMSPREGIFLLSSKDCDFSTDDVIIRFKDDLDIKEIGKNLQDGDAISAGLMIVKGKKSRDLFKKNLENVARRDDFLAYNKTWHSYINDLVNNGVTVESLIVHKSDWSELDLHFDLKDIQTLLKNKIKF